MLNIGEELAGLKKKNALIPVLKLSKNQMSFISREITKSSEDELWSETEQLREMFSLSFIELGRRLHELQQRYAKNKNGSFQKRYQEKGFKKTQVQTLISKYLLFQEQKNIGRDATDIILIAEKIESASQKVTAKLKKTTPEVKEKFFNGEIKGTEIMDAEVVEPILKKNIGRDATDIKKDGMNQEKKKELLERKKELKNKIQKLSKEIGDCSDEIFAIEQELENSNNLKLINQ